MTVFQNISILKIYLAALICFNNIGLSGQPVLIGYEQKSTTDSVKINNDITCYYLQDTANSASSKSLYIRVNTDYYRTLFTLTELKNFLTTGKISSLGEIRKKQLPYKKEMLKVTYLSKGNTNLMFLIRPDYLYVIEYYGKIENFFTQKYKTVKSNGKEQCQHSCDIIYQLETFFGKQDKDAYEDRKVCETDCLIESANKSHPDYYIYKVPVRNLSVKFK